MGKKNTDLDRRQFLKSGAVAVTAMAAIGAGVTYLKKVRGTDTRSHMFLRPPGAVHEEDFIYGCIKCGLCVQICPIQAVKLAGINEALSYGTPYIDVREQACDFSCDSLQCVETCPTAVLDFKQYEEVGGNALTEYQKEHDVSDPNFNPFKVQIKAMKEAVKMGMAKVNVETCLAVKGEGFTGTPRGEDFDGVNRTPGRGLGKGLGRGQGKGLGRGQGKGLGRQGHGMDEGEHDEGSHDQNIVRETKATPLRNKHFDREICDLCVTECPIGCKAIEMIEVEGKDDKLAFKPNVLEGCTGCGVCVMVCPTQEPSIIVEPLKQESHV
ncbi:MAG: 4Fe-4S dicluster domain-containing protein [Bacteroidales bacterium]|nr:4Fe-4S dicluster domain-containing protein [Bacteroidales bacterium]